MFASHLWVRAAAVMSGGAEEPSPVKAFLSPLNLLEYRDSATCSRSLGPACPGSTARGRDSPGRRPARGRPGVGTHSGSALPQYDIHYESPGVPDPPPSPGFRDRYMVLRNRFPRVCCVVWIATLTALTSANFNGGPSESAV